MALCDWHHNFRLSAVRVIGAEGQADYELVTVFKRENEEQELGFDVCELRADEALALGDLLRLWAQGALARKDKANG